MKTTPGDFYSVENKYVMKPREKQILMKNATTSSSLLFDLVFKYYYHRKHKSRNSVRNNKNETFSKHQYVIFEFLINYCCCFILTPSNHQLDP